MDALTVCWIAAALIVALAALGGCVWLVRTTRPETHSFDGYVFASFFLLGIVALVALAVGLGRVGGLWAAAALIAVNVLIQPVCLYLFAGAAYKLGMALAGRVVYAWRVVPFSELQPEEYRSLRRYCLSQGIVGCLFASYLGLCCLGLLL